MSDSIDSAQERAEDFLKWSLARAQNAEPDGPQERDAQGRVICAECGELMPAARLAAVPGVTLCVRCAEEAEDHGGMT
ncbi:MAG: hypothetical protein AUJ49_03265 [Desulfovibrionaceae bacterium CG1_02_65_16]|nr:MAG: hypothetical protein AUJ49_03265 [Desulfovibrionaceae bacterium CG1_02_65_16]